MKRAAALATCGLMVLLGAVALASSGISARPLSLATAVHDTAHVASQRYAMHVTISRHRRPTTLNVRGAIAPGTHFVHVGMTAVTLADGTKVPGPDGAELLDGPFLYLRAPSSISVYGGIHWLRVRVATLRPTAPMLSGLHEMSPTPLLRVLAESRATATKFGRVFRGSVAYDDPVVRTALRRFAGGLEFRALQVTAWVGNDGRVHGIQLRGRTPDGSATLKLAARLYAFGRPVSVTPPKPGTFMDKELLGLDE